MNERRRKQIAKCALAAMLGGQLISPRVFAANDDDKRQEESREHRDHRTATPIKHVIVLIGENRTFDNVYGTYVPRHGQHVSNLLSEGIVNADGTPGPNRALARQFRLATINPVSLLHQQRQADRARQDGLRAVPAHARGRQRAAARP